LVSTKGAVVLVRNPFDSIESQFQLYRTGVHTTIAEQIDPEAWKRHVLWAVSSWNKFYEYWTVTVPSEDYPGTFLLLSYSSIMLTIVSSPSLRSLELDSAHREIRRLERLPRSATPKDFEVLGR